MNCKTQTIISYIATLIFLASLYYLARKGSVGTPFNDSLTEQQIMIKNQSRNTRSKLFYEGCVLAGVILFVLKPFGKILM